MTRSQEVVGEVLAKSHDQAKRVAKMEIMRSNPGYEPVGLTVSMKDGLRLHSSPLATWEYWSMLRKMEPRKKKESK